MSDAIEAILRAAGLTDKPGEFDSSIHSWRCEHPDRYGKCDCFQELVRELAEVERAAAEKAWDRCVNEMPIDPDWKNFYSDNNPYRAEAYRQERGEQ